MTEDGPLAAGGLAAWLRGMQRALDGEVGSDVPCGGCTACCASSQFVHIGPDEVDTLAHVPAELLFPAPRMPAGNVLLGYDERGRCPLLTDGGCSIYEHRPRTCRTYDCRVFPATGLEPEEPDKALVARQARRWRFDLDTEEDRLAHRALRAAARYVREHAGELPSGAGAATTTQEAVLAVRLHGAFLDAGEGDDSAGRRVVAEPAPEAVEAPHSPPAGPASHGSPAGPASYDGPAGSTSHGGPAGPVSGACSTSHGPAGPMGSAGPVGHDAPAGPAGDNPSGRAGPVSPS